ncbi:MAG TPA: hypothetical protein VMJ32_03780 [Pirellulales bacterium]|nr:hypothetical protein [Pirellulales bacterium]
MPRPVPKAEVEPFIEPKPFEPPINPAPAPMVRCPKAPPLEVMLPVTPPPPMLPKLEPPVPPYPVPMPPPYWAQAILLLSKQPAPTRKIKDKEALLMTEIIAFQ